MDKKYMCKCGHDKWSHAIGLKGDVGPCLKEIYKGWKYCDCKKFEPVDEKSLDKQPET